MAPKLYAAEISPAVRATLLVAKALGVDLELVPVNLFAGEQMSDEYLQMNPMHSIPTLKDGDFVVWDSHAINIYLIEKYQPETDLYPKCVEQRATIHQRMFLDAGVIFPKAQDIIRGLIKEGVKTVSKDKADKVVEGYNFLESILERSEYAAGDKLTLADLTLITSVVASGVLVPIASNRYPKISDWIAKMEQLPYYKDAMHTGHEQFIAMIKSKLAC